MKPNATWVRDDLDGEVAQCGAFVLAAHPKLEGYGATVGFDGRIVASSERTYPNLETAKVGAYVLAEQILGTALSDVKLMRRKHPKQPRGIGWRGRKKTA